MSLFICNSIDEVKIENIRFNTPIKNKIICNEHSAFIGVFYVSQSFSATNLCISFNITNPICIEFKENDDGANKYKSFFYKANNETLVDFLSNIEDIIFNKYFEKNPYKKTVERVYMLKKYVSTNNKYIKYYKLTNKVKNKFIIPYEKNNENKYILKISGIWENNGKLGLSYKIIQPSVL